MTTLTDMLARAGCVAADEEAAEWSRPRVATAQADRARPPAHPGRAAGLGHRDGDLRRSRRHGRSRGLRPPLAEPELRTRAAARLPESGHAIDLCTGSGAIAATLACARPGACRRHRLRPARRGLRPGQRRRGLRGDLFDPVPVDFRGRTDVVVAVVPYVPTPALHLLPHDMRTFEAATHYHGGLDGTDVLRRVIEGAPKFLRPGGALLSSSGARRPRWCRRSWRSLGYRE